MWRSIFVLLIVLMLSGSQAAAQSKRLQPEEPSFGEWIELFNGRDLTGWTRENGTATYRVIDGTIVGTTAEGSPNSFLCTDRDFGDFELEFDVKLTDPLNSGVQIRSLSKPDYKNGRVHGPQVEIEQAPGDAGYIYSEGTGRGWLSKKRPVQDAFKNDDWNHYRVIAKGDRIQTWLNGRAIEDLRDAESSKRGFIGLQVHAIGKGSGPFSVAWRKIRIRELSVER